MNQNEDGEYTINAQIRLSIIKSHLSQSNSNKSKSYLYTVQNGILTDEQRDFYEKNGFLLIKNLISAEKLEEYKSRFQAICAQKLQIPGMTVMKDVAIAKSEFLEGEKAITKIQDFCYDDELFKYCRLPEISQYVRSFTGPNIMAIHTMLINKPPGLNIAEKLLIFKI